MISIKKITSKKVHNSSLKPIINALSYEIPTNRITTITGTSGAGKTTLLRCIAGLEEIQSGEIIIDGIDASQLSLQNRARLIGFVFQDYNLFPHLTALENCIQPLIINNIATRENAQKIAETQLTHLNMAEYSNSYPHQLSGGQKQRIAIARALCLNPKILLLDEPTSALDLDNTLSLVTILKQLCATGITIIIVSQDSAFVELIKDNNISLSDGTIQ